MENAMRVCAAVVLAGVCVSGFAGSAMGQGVPSAYKIVELPAIAGSTISSARAINNSGMVVGHSYNGSTWTATVWTPGGAAADLGFLGASSGGRALDINDNGDVLFGAVGASTQVIGWAVRFVDGREEFVEAQGIYDSPKVYGMNSYGEVCGSVYDEVEEELFAAIWRPTPGGFVQEAPLINPFVFTGYATAINDAGLVATTQWYATGGSSTFDRRSGAASDGFRGAQLAQYVDLNNVGEGVVLHDRDVSVIAATVPGVGDVYPLNCDGTGPFGSYCLESASVVPSAINESAVVVGKSPTVEFDSQGYPYDHNGIYEAIVWSEEVGTQKCLDLIVEGDTTGWLLTEAYDINDAGWIVGQGLKDGVVTGYLLIPREPCVADTNRDGQVTPADFTAWISAFNAGCD